MANKRKGMHCIVSSVEHSSVKEPFNFLEKEGFRITYLSVDKDGIVDIEALKDALDDETILVSVMYVIRFCSNRSKEYHLILTLKSLCY